MKQIVLPFILVICLSLGLASCGSVPITGRNQLSLVSDSEVLSLGLQEYNNYISTANISTNASQTQLVRRVGEKIAEAVTLYYTALGMEAELANYSWEFNLVEDASANAFCLPGGKIVVNTGILPICQDETGLAVVLGHEVGHAIAKHANEQMSQQMILQYGSNITSSLLDSKSEKMKSIASTVYGLGAQYGVLLPYSRKHELEADRIGLVLMAIAGYDPNQAISFWQRMAANSSGSIEFLSTHPSDTSRVNEIRKFLPEAMEYYNSIWGSGGSSTTTPSTTTKKSTTSSDWSF